MLVTELNRNQLEELKQNYLTQLEESGELLEVTGKEVVDTDLLLKVNEFISDSEIFNNYEGVIFSSDDFFCSCN